MKFRLLFSFVFFCLFSTTSHGQVFQGKTAPVKSIAPAEAFFDYEVVQLDVQDLVKHVRSNVEHAEFNLQVGSFDWKLTLQPSNIVPDNYVLQVHADNGIKTYGKTVEKAFLGTELKGGGHVRMTLDDNYLSGYVTVGMEEYFIEPLSTFEPGAPKENYVLYAASAVKPNTSVKCGVTEAMEFKQKHEPQAPSTSATESVFACYETDVAIASDKSMFTKYGSITAVENHNITVMNNVEGNYTGSFIHDIQYVIPTQIVITGTDPWSNTLDAGDLLDEFRTWGNQGNFGTTFDLGELWTNRNFTGSTIGIAWVGAVCTSFKYHVIQDYTTSAWGLRVVVAHEIGHNWDLTHDASGSGFIMAPSVNNTNTWSPASISDFNSYMPTRISASCITACSGGGGGTTPPVANFNINPNPACTGNSVQFTDVSTNSPTSWSWSFPGGTPSSSSAQNPVVTYATTGTKTATLVAANAGGNSTKSNSLTVQASANAFATASVNLLTATFTNSSSNATSYFWDFGDGTTGVATNPSHIYAVGGVYTVTLTATNTCGSHTYSLTVSTAATPNFTTNLTTGCPPFIVTFDNLSSSTATSYFWQFPGATPGSSTAFEPTVSYLNPGTYSVTLQTFSAAGTLSLTKQGYITVLDDPISNFTYTQNGLSVNFNQTAQAATSYFWEFGDGTTSTAPNPNHNYSTAGTYTVSLEVNSSCGSATYTENIMVLEPPSAAFTSDVVFGCSPLTVQYTNQSSGTNLNYLWTFPGGTPTTSTDEHPVVVYENLGIYDVSLEASNGLGFNTHTENNWIEIIESPFADFNFTTNGSMVSFINQSTSADSYAWDFGDGNLGTNSNETHTYSAAGTYSVILTATNTCGVTNITKAVTVILPPTAAFNASPTSGCSPHTVQYTSTSVGANSYNWTFPGGTPASSTDANPVVVYNTNGIFSASLEAGNSAGTNSVMQNDIINIGQGPNVSFTVASTTSGTATYTFTNSSTAADTYTWDFGDGNSSSDISPTHTYSTDGTYTVVLTATNSCGANSATETVVVTTPVSAAFTASATSGCSPFTVHYTSAASANTTSFSWSFPNGTPSASTDPNPTVVYSTPGTYSVVFTASNAGFSAAANEVDLISVGQGPNTAFSAATSNAAVSFTNTSTSATAYTWDFGDGNTATNANPTHTYGADGTYTVVLTASNACGSNTATQMVTVVTPVSAAFTASATTGCTPFTVHYTSAASSNTTGLLWTFEGGTPATSTDANPTVVYNAVGTFDVSLTASNSAFSNTIDETDYISIGQEPNTAFSAATSNAAVSFTNTSTSATAYTWDFGDGNTATDTNPTHTYGADGTYTVVLTASNACGSNTATQTVTVVTPVSAAFTASATTGCTPFTVQYTSAASSNTTGLSWTFEGGTPATSTDANPTVVYNSVGLYDVSLTASNAAFSNTLDEVDYISIGQGPNTAFSAATSNAAVTFTNASTAANAFSWDFGDGNTATDTNPTHTYGADGTYTVVLTASNACGSNTATQMVTVVTPVSAAFTASVTTGCTPFTVHYTSAASSNTTGLLWTFEGGTPATSTDANPTVVYNAVGTFDVSLTASNSAFSNTIDETDYISIGQGPNTAFSAATSNAAVSFTNTSTAATAYTWDFGNGNTATNANPTHTYGADGTYTVVLTASNACGSSTATQTVTVVTPPTANFMVSSTSGCPPFTVQFTNASSTNATSYAWTFAGGTPSTSTDANPTVIFNTAGSFDISLEVSNLAGSDQMVGGDIITVLDMPSADFVANGNGAQYTFSNNSSFATSYTWDFGDGNISTDANPSHMYATDGTYTVLLTASNTCGSTTFSQVLTVLTAPNAGFTASATSACAPFTVQFTNTSSSNATTYAWIFAGGTPATSTDANPVVVFDTPGTYTISLEASNAIGASTSTEVDYITMEGLPNVAFLSSNVGTTFSFTNNSSAASYLWDFGDGNTSTDANPSHTYNQAGTFTVTLTATNNCGFTVQTQSVTVVGTTPTAQFSSDLSITCMPDTIQFFDNSMDNPTAWAWTFPGGTPATSTDENPIVIYNQAGLYDVSLEVSNSFGQNSTTESDFIQIETFPTADFDHVVMGATVDFTSAATNATTYFWDFGDGTSSNDANPSHVYAAPGNYLVTLMTANGCGVSTITNEVAAIFVGTSDLKNDFAVQLFPNPNKGLVRLSIHQGLDAGLVQVQLYNALGQLLSSQDFEYLGQDFNQELDYQGVASGVYFVQIKLRRKTTQVRMMVE